MVVMQKKVSGALSLTEFGSFQSKLAISWDKLIRTLPCSSTVPSKDIKNSQESRADKILTAAVIKTVRGGMQRNKKVTKLSRETGPERTMS